MLGATTLGQWNRGQAFIIGWPLLTVRASLGLSDSFDLGLGFDSYYGAMNEFRGTARVKVASREGWAFAVVAEAGGALFGSSAQREQRGPRWITGRRNWNVVPGFVASYQGAGPRAPRLFIDTRYMLAVDLEPYSTDPLSGVPPNIIFGHNVLLRVGAEVPLSVKTSFLFELGMDIHGRDIDSVVMPFASLGIVAGL